MYEMSNKAHVALAYYVWPYSDFHDLPINIILHCFVIDRLVP